MPTALDTHFELGTGEESAAISTEGNLRTKHAAFLFIYFNL